MAGYIEHSHDASLVVLSYIVAMFASYTALDMGERLRNAAPRSRWFWLAGSALVLGGGIWSMHFIAMLAFEIPLPVHFDASLTVLSLVIAVLFTALGFHVVTRESLSMRRLVAAGVIVGLGVAAMHYTGMAAVRIGARVFYDPLLFATSIVIAVAAATVALWLAFSLRTTWQKLAAAAVMAAAICGMHYTGMAATIITATPNLRIEEADTISKPLLALAVAAATFVILCLALISVFVDRRFGALAEREAEALRAANERLRKEIAVRLVAEERLRQAHDALEERVEERTRALGEANDRLMAAAGDLEAARRRAESEKDRAEAANRAKSDFLAKMSHELRTPLNSILGFAQLLALNAKEPLSAKQARQVTQIQKSGQHLLSLIDDILDLSRIEAGNVKFSIEAVPVEPVLDQIRSVLQPLADEAGVTFDTSCVGAPPSARVDRTRLIQILMNLGSNAIKYNRPGGTATLVAELAESGRVRFSMIDSGRGIPPERKAELFQPFNRLGAEHGSIEGTGIGLSITKRLVDLMDGSIEVESTTGVGTRFIVEFAAARLQPAELADSERRAALASESHAGSYTLLYVEDNSSNIKLMEELVESLSNVRLLVATDPGIGLALARAHRPDLIVLDINLPGMSGFELLDEIKATPAIARVPVLALSAAAMPREIERGKAAGFVDYLTKPINVSQFLSAVDSALAMQA